jgi:hypothetical protein
MKFDQTAIENAAASWENKELGCDEQSVVVAGAEHENNLEELLELQAISIRLPTELVKKYKLIASYHGVGYQPLMRDMLHRQVKDLLKEIADMEEAKPPKEPLWPTLRKVA